MKKYTLKSVGLFVLTWLLFVIPFWGLTYTSDWAGYVRMFEEPELSRDFLFRLLSVLLGNHGYTFIDLYRLHIIAIGGLYALVFRKLRLNPLLALFVVITLYYVPIGNQIRFFIAFPLVILSMYRFSRRQYVGCIVDAVLAILSHKTALVLFVAYLFSYNLSRKPWNLQRKWIIMANFVLIILVHFSYLFGSKYDDYLNNISSIFGGIYNSAVYLVPIYWIFKTNKQILQLQDIVRNSYYRYLYAISIGTSIFFLSGVSMQILTIRFISTLVPVWMAYFLYCSSIHEFTYSFRRRLRYYAIISVVLVYVKQYIMDGMFGFKYNFYEASQMLLSYQL